MIRLDPTTPTMEKQSRAIDRLLRHGRNDRLWLDDYEPALACDAESHAGVRRAIAPVVAAAAQDAVPAVDESPYYAGCYVPVDPADGGMYHGPPRATDDIYVGREIVDRTGLCSALDDRDAAVSALYAAVCARVEPLAAVVYQIATRYVDTGSRGRQPDLSGAHAAAYVAADLAPSLARELMTRPTRWPTCSP